MQARHYYPSIPNTIELFAYCLYDAVEDDNKGDFIHINHCYKVIRFVECDGFFPYGVRIADYKGNELDQTFYMQRFAYMEHFLN